MGNKGTSPGDPHISTLCVADSIPPGSMLSWCVSLEATSGMNCPSVWERSLVQRANIEKGMNPSRLPFTRTVYFHTQQFVIVRAR